MPLTTRRLITAAALAVFVIAGVMVFVTIPANAQTGRTAVCTGRGSIAALGHTADQQLQVWMTQQIAQGKTQFIVVDNNTVVCSW